MFRPREGVGEGGEETGGSDKAKWVGGSHGGRGMDSTVLRFLGLIAALHRCIVEFIPTWTLFS